MCRENIGIVDAGFNTSVSYDGIANRNAAKALCDLCPIMRECGDYVIGIEGNDPGSLGGVYGGMDPWNRRGTDLQANWRGVICKVPWHRPRSG